VKTALPNWISAGCLLIITALFVGWSIYGLLFLGQFKHMEDEMKSIERSVREAPDGPYSPQPSQQSSEWGK
jgi:hypothetical protein